MKHFLGYHNFERMEEEAEEEALQGEEETTEAEGKEEQASDLSDDEAYPYYFVTRKKPDRFIGNVIWGIQGQGKPREYYLFDWFIVDGAKELKDERFAVEVYGSRGESFPEGFYLNDLDWFPEFRKVNNNFSLGIQEIA